MVRVLLPILTPAAMAAVAGLAMKAGLQLRFSARLKLSPSHLVAEGVMVEPLHMAPMVQQAEHLHSALTCQLLVGVMVLARRQ